MEELRRAIEEKTPIDIYFRVSNMKTDCLIAYRGFLVIEINKDKNTFIGYKSDQRTLPQEEKILTEDTIGAICKIEFP